MPLDVILLVATFAPLAGFVLPTVLGASSAGLRLAPGAVAVSAGCWFALLVADESASFERLAPDALVVVTCLGIAILATGVLAGSGPPVTGASATALMIGLAVTTPSGRPSALALTVGVVAAVLLAAVVTGSGLQLGRSSVAAAPAVGAGLLVVAMLVLHDNAGSYDLSAIGAAGWVTPLLFLTAGVFLVAAALPAGSRLAPLVLVLPVGLACCLRAAPAIDDRSVLVVALTALAVLAAAAGPARFPVEPAAASVALWAVVAAIVPTASAGEARAASLLLAAAAVLIAAIGHPLSIVAAVPGGLTVVHALAGSLDGWMVLVAVGLAATVILLASQLLSVAPPTFGWFEWVAVALAGWLVLAPRTWTWAGGQAVGAYDEGIAIAVGVGLVVAVTVGMAARRGTRTASG